MNRFAWLLAAIILVIVVWCGGWYFAAGWVTREVDNLATTQPAISCDNTHVGGFPFRFDVTCTGFTLVDADITLTMPEMRASVLVYRPTHVQAYFKSPASYSDAFYGSDRKLSWQSAETSLRLDGFKLARFSFVADQLALSDTLFGDSLVASADHFEAHLLDMPELDQPDLDLMTAGNFIRADNLALPANAIADGQINFEANIINLPEDIRTWSQTDILQRWQAADGKLNIIRLDIQDALGSLNGDGDLSLTETGQATGKLSVKSQGIVERFGDLVPDQFRTVILGNKAPDGSYSQTINLRNGLVFVGLLPVAQFPALF